MNYPISQLTSTGAGLANLSYQMRSLVSEVDAVNAAISGCYGAGGVGSRAAYAAGSISGQAGRVQHLGEVATVAARLYVDAENQLCSTVFAMSGEMYEPKSIPNPVVTTTTPKEMGTLTKIWKTGAAAVSIIGAGVATVAAWSVAGLSAGFGVPGAALVSIYSLNTVSNKVTDIWNIWGGDQSEVGNVNYLKSTLAEGYGNLSEMLCGDREIGEKIGNGIYSIGEFGSTVVSVRSLSLFHGGGSALTTHGDDIKNELLSKSPGNKIDKYLQSDVWDQKYYTEYQKMITGKTGNAIFDTGVNAIKEIPTAISGYLDIFFNTPLGKLRYDATLLGYQIENFNKASSFLKSSLGIFNLAKDAADFFIPSEIINGKEPTMMDAFI